MKTHFTRILKYGSLLCTTLMAGYLIAAPAQAQGNYDLWKEVKARRVLKCATAVTPPYIIHDPLTQQWGGPFVQLCQEFATNVLHVKAEMVNTTWDTMVAGIQANRWDMGMSLSQTPEREKSIEFSSPVIYSSVTFSYDKHNSKLSKPDSVADFDSPDLTVAVMSGSIADSTVTQTLKKAHIMRLPGAQEATMALLSHRADVYADDIGTNMIVVAAHPANLAVYEPKPALSPLPAGFGLRKDISAADLALLDKFVDQQRTSGNIDKLVKEAAAKSIGH